MSAACIVYFRTEGAMPAKRRDRMSDLVRSPPSNALVDTVRDLARSKFRGRARSTDGTFRGRTCASSLSCILGIHPGG